MTMAPEIVADFAFRLIEAAGNNVWNVGLVNVQSFKEIALHIVNHANSLEEGVASLHELNSPIALEKSLRTPGARIWVGFGFDRFSEEDWKRLDRNRSRLIRDGVIVLIMSAEVLGRLQNCAPNLASFIGGAVYWLREQEILSPEAREARLHELREHRGISDEEFLKNVETGVLLPDALDAERLVLLDRGDLLDHR
jgi:hypothetical protein